MTYDVWVDDDSDISSPIENASGITDDNYQVTTELAEGVWYWRVRAVDNAGNVGDNSQRSFRVDVTPPTVVKVLTGTGGKDNWWLSDVTVTLTGTDPSPASGIENIEYSDDCGSTWNLYTGPFQITTEGTTTLHHRANDKARNQSDDVIQDIKMDKTPPEVVKVLTGTEGKDNWWKSDVTVTLTATDATSGVENIEYSLDCGATWENYTGPITITDEGVTPLYHRAWDKAGNVTETPPRYLDNLRDLEDPVSSILHELYPEYCGRYHLTSWVDTNLDGMLSPSDIIDMVDLGTDELLWFHVDEVTITMLVENLDNIEQIMYIELDPGLFPIWDIIIKYDPFFTSWHEIWPHFSRWYLLTSWFDDNPDGVLGPSDIIDMINEYGEMTWWHVVDVKYDIIVTETQVIKIDNTPPDVVKVLSGTEGKDNWWQSDVTVTLTAEDPVPPKVPPCENIASGVENIEYSLDNGATWILYTAPFDVTDEGVTTLYHRANDKASNQSDNVIQDIMIDKTPPEVVKGLTGTPGKDNWWLSDVTVTMTATDAISGVENIEYSLDNGVTWTLYTAPFDITDEGVTTLYHRANDSASNQSDNVIQDIRIDKTPPEVVKGLTGTPGKDNWWLSDVTVTMTGTDPSPGSGLENVEYSLDSGATWILYDESFTITDEGVTTIHHRANDNAGNTSETENQDIKIDKTPPGAPTLVEPENEAFINDNTPNLDWDAVVDLSGVSYCVQVDDDADFSSPIENVCEIVDDNYQVQVELAEVTWYWHVRAADGACNKGPWSENWSFTVDVTPPELIISISDTVTEIDNGVLEAIGTITITVVSNEPLSDLDVEVDHPSYSTEVDMTPENEENITWTGEFEIDGWGWHTIWATGWDLAGNDNYASLGFNGIPLREFDIELYPGWNLISLPLIPENDNIENILSGILADVVIVWAYDASTGEWLVYDPDAPGWAIDLLTMEDGKGYWMFMTEENELTIRGYELLMGPTPPPSYPVYEGWNLIGFKSRYDMEAIEYLNDIIPESEWPFWEDWWEWYWYHNIELYTYYADYGGFGSLWWDDDMYPGLGYWLYVPEDGMIVPPIEY